MNRIRKLANRLRLPYIKNYYQEAINEALDQHFSYEQFLEYLLTQENVGRDRNSIEKRIKSAKFPYLKYLTDLRFDSFPIEVANQIRVYLNNFSFIQSRSECNLCRKSWCCFNSYCSSIGLVFSPCMEFK
jgi:DNA replication protein DnaC